MNSIRGYGSLIPASTLETIRPDTQKRASRQIGDASAAPQGDLVQVSPEAKEQALTGASGHQIALIESPQGRALTTSSAGIDREVWGVLTDVEQRFLGGSVYGPGGLLTDGRGSVGGKLDIRL